MHTDDDDDDDDDDDVDAVDNDDCTLCTPGCRVSASGAPTSSLQSKCRRLVFPLSSQFLIKVNRHHYCLFVLSGILNFHDISFKIIIVKKFPSKTSKQSSGKESNACWCSLAFIPALLFIVRCGQLPMFGILSTVQDKSSERALFDGVGSTLCSLPGFWENWPQGRNLIRQLLSGALRLPQS